MRILALAFAFTGALAAQNFTGQIRIPLVPPLSKPWKTVPLIKFDVSALPPEAFRAAGSRPCAAPLLTAKTAPGDTAMIVAPRDAEPNLPAATPPAPPCDATVRR